MDSFVTFVLMAREKQGVLERAGEEIDEAVEDVGAGGETVGNKMDDARKASRTPHTIA